MGLGAGRALTAAGVVVAAPVPKMAPQAQSAPINRVVLTESPSPKHQVLDDPVDGSLVHTRSGVNGPIHPARWSGCASTSGESRGTVLGGTGGIRTPGPCEPPAFKAGAFVRSATVPGPRLPSAGSIGV